MIARNPRLLIFRVPTRERRPSQIMRGVSGAAAPPLAKVHSNERLRTRGRASSASCKATRPPNECPTTCADSTPSPSSTARASSAICGTVMGAAAGTLRPTPRLSNVTQV